MNKHNLLIPLNSTQKMSVTQYSNLISVQNSGIKHVYPLLNKADHCFVGHLCGRLEPDGTKFPLYHLMCSNKRSILSIFCRFSYFSVLAQRGVH